MFTLLPSLCLVAVHYYRQWKSPYYYEHISTVEEEEEKEKTHDAYVNQDIFTETSKEVIENYHDSLLQSHQDSSKINDHVFTRSQGNEINDYLPAVINDEDNRYNQVKLRPKRLSRSSSLLNVDRRKTFTGDLTESDIIYLMNETGFTREQILLWHSDFLVSFSGFEDSDQRWVSSSVTVPMVNSRNTNSSIFTNSSTRKVKWRSFANMPFVFSTKTGRAISVCDRALSCQTSILMRCLSSVIRFRRISHCGEHDFHEGSSAENRTVLLNVRHRSQWADRRERNAVCC